MGVASPAIIRVARVITIGGLDGPCIVTFWWLAVTDTCSLSRRLAGSHQRPSTKNPATERYGCYQCMGPCNYLAVAAMFCSSHRTTTPSEYS